MDSLTYCKCKGLYLKGLGYLRGKGMLYWMTDVIARVARVRPIGYPKVMSVVPSLTHSLHVEPH